jgi:hypothetical protein
VIFLKSFLSSVLLNASDGIGFGHCSSTSVPN